MPAALLNYFVIALPQDPLLAFLVSVAGVFVIFRPWDDTGSEIEGAGSEIEGAGAELRVVFRLE